MGGDQGETHAQEHGAEGPDEDALGAFAGWEGMDGHGDDHGIVAGEYDIDQDDAEEVEQEAAGGNPSDGRRGQGSQGVDDAGTVQLCSP